MKMTRNYPTVLLIFFTFFVISFLTNIIGPLIPEIIEDFQLSLTMVALLPFAFFIAYAVMSIPAGILVEKFGEKGVMLSAFLIAFLGALSLALFHNYLTAILSLFIIGTGMAMLQVAINPLLRTAGGEENFAFNSTLVQFFFGTASFLSPLIYSYLVLNLENPASDPNFIIRSLQPVVPEELSWISMYWVFAILALFMIVLIRAVRFPKVELKEDEKAGSAQSYLSLIKDPKVMLFFFGIFFYVGTEQGVNNWMSEYLQEYHGFDPQTIGARAVSRFWGLMTLGAVPILFMLKFIDSRKVLIAFSLSAIVLLTISLFGTGETAKFAFPLMGVCASAMWPMIISLALNSFKEHHGTLSGILITGIVGGAVWPLLIGSVGDFMGLRSGLFLLYISLGYILSIGFWAKPLVSNKTLRRKTES
jgi:fucose permease